MIEVVIGKCINGLVFNREDYQGWIDITGCDLHFYELRVRGGDELYYAIADIERPTKYCASILASKKYLGDELAYDDLNHDDVFDTDRISRESSELKELARRKAKAGCDDWKVVCIPDGVDYVICSSEQGQEWVAERHRVWD